MNEVMISVRLTKVDKEKLKKQANEQGLSTSTLARVLIKQGLKNGRV